MTTSLDCLIDRLDGLLEDLTRAEVEHADAIDAVAPEHALGAINLVHYTTLRRHDLRDLQRQLTDLGVTSLAAAEPNIRAKVRAARNVLGALRGDPGPWEWEAIRDALREGTASLNENARVVLGPIRTDHPIRIMVTLPSEAATEPELVTAFVQAGMDIARINCAHDDPASWTRMAAHVRSAAAASGRPVFVSMDLPGPKLRTGPIIDGPAVGRARVTRDESGRLMAPARIWLTPTARPYSAPPTVAPATRPALTLHVDATWLKDLRIGDHIALTDARGRSRRFTVTHVEAAGTLAASDRSAYVALGAALTCHGRSTQALGIPTVIRKLPLRVGDRLVLTADLTPVDLPAPGEVARIGCTLPEAIAAMRPGDPVALDDGAITCTVDSTIHDGAILRVEHTKPGGQFLGAAKGINLPDTVIPLPALTSEDSAYVPFVAEHADLVAVSFVRTTQDIEHVLTCLERAGAQHLGLVLKIETRQGFENLPSILLTAMRHRRLAVMIARGDLAVEVGFERLADLPRQILALCEAAHVPAIWATQVLETLAKTGAPSRAEITDAAAGQRADCVMLNKGPHVLEAIHVLDDILVRMGQVQAKGQALMRHIHSWDPE